MEGVILKQSRGWWVTSDLKWILANSDFAFTHSEHNGNRVKIVTKTAIDDNRYNLFELDNDQYGIIVGSQSQYTPFLKTYNGYKEAHGHEMLTMILTFLDEYGAGCFVNPKPPNAIEIVINYFSKRKDKLFKIDANCQPI